MKKYTRLMYPIILPILFLILWHILSIRIDNRIILPKINSIISIFMRPNQDLVGIGSLFRNVYVSLIRVMIGYIVAVFLAVPLGILIGSSKNMEKIFLSFLNLFRPIPPLAWVPLVLAWFGIASLATILGIERGSWYIFLNNIKISMIFIIFIGAFFPILTNTVFGIQNVQKTLVDSALTLGAKKANILLKILLPAALPSIITGLRVGLGVAWMCLVSAEMLPGSIAGVGYLITHSYQVARVDIVIAGITAISIMGAFFDGIFRFIEKKFFKWQSMVK